MIRINVTPEPDTEEAMDALTGALNHCWKDGFEQVLGTRSDVAAVWGPNGLILHAAPDAPEQGMRVQAGWGRGWENACRTSLTTTLRFRPYDGEPLTVVSVDVITDETP